ncbi:hypothetical protein HELRODRAFT_158462 [Helobdella robusta]|uniref:Uncharacterized protein n=1 Tax=Helobdella robusta TaxID=6412 RepID=T1EMT6_HELRO|nr:hypothetical protein HELRODRAFT_158462 [Helobdella robusta]ESO12053.1 hypothetical protein HELRODRAFT_158462 [Helobdella robusta]
MPQHLVKFEIFGLAGSFVSFSCIVLNNFVFVKLMFFAEDIKDNQQNAEKHDALPQLSHLFVTEFYDEYSRNIQSYSSRMKSYTGEIKKNKCRVQEYMDHVNKYIKSMQSYVDYLHKKDSCSKIGPNKSIYSKRYRPY